MTTLAIDLGTTNSLCSIYTETGAQLIPNSLGKFITPSVVSLNDKFEVIVGQPALDFGLAGKHPFVRSFKRYMGSNKTFILGKTTFSPEELSALVLSALKKDAEIHLGVEVRDAIISVPAYFNNKQRQATKIAGQLAGLNVIRLINEPTAAALAYGIANKEKETKYLIFDLGGGTFDVTIMELFEGVLEVRSSAGDNYLGGDDFTEAIVESFLKKSCINKNNINTHDYQKIWQQAEKCKTSHLKDTFNIKVDLIKGIYNVHFTQDEMQEIFQPLYNRLIAPIKKALIDSRLRSEDIESVILVGGATNLPMIHKICATVFKKMPFFYLNPQEVVALGAAHLAGMLANKQDLQEVVLSDVSPYTLGTACLTEQRNGKLSLSYAPIIERNSVIPISRSKTFYTSVENQKMLSITVYQGESRIIQNNIKIAEYDINIPKPTEYLQALELRFTYDVNGILEVQLKFENCNEIFTKIIKESCGNISDQSILNSLSKLKDIKIHPRDIAQNIAVIARAERLYEQSLGDNRKIIDEKIQWFQTDLDSQDIKAIEAARGQFHLFLDQFEDAYE